MGWSDLFSFFGGVLSIGINLYVTYLILKPGCDYSAFFVIMTMASAFLFMGYAVATLLETDGGVGISYLAMQAIYLAVSIYNLYLIYTPKCDLRGFRRWLYDQQLSFGRGMQFILRPLRASLPECPPCEGGGAAPGGGRVGPPKAGPPPGPSGARDFKFSA